MDKFADRYPHHPCKERQKRNSIESRKMWLDPDSIRDFLDTKEESAATWEILRPTLKSGSSYQHLLKQGKDLHVKWPNPPISTTSISTKVINSMTDTIGMKLCFAICVNST